jgi:muconate cycloisomerase
MRIERIEVIPLRMPLKAVLTLPRGASRSLDEGKRVALVRMTADDGTVGWGEAGPSRRWSAETLESCVSALRRYLAPAVIGRDPFDIAGLHAAMNREIAPGLDPGQPIAKNAIDIAVHDLICRKLGIGLQDWLGTKAQDHVRLARLISASTPTKAAELTAEAREQGYEGMKVKVGHDPAHDAAIMHAVAAEAGDAVVWPDANQGYTLAEAIDFARRVEPLNLPVFEQPVAMTDIYGMKKLLSATPMLVALDEATVGIPFVIELLRREAIEGVAIKINKMGGLYHARQMCDLARNAGLALIGSGLMDAPVGFAASVHLYAGYGITMPVDLNGPQFIAEDYLAQPFPMQGQRALVPTGTGLGIDIDEDKVARFAEDLVRADRDAGEPT